MDDLMNYILSSGDMLHVPDALFNMVSYSVINFYQQFAAVANLVN